MDSRIVENVITLAEAAAMLSSLPKNLEEEVIIPYVLERQRLMKPGVWNGIHYDKQVLSDAYSLTDWAEPRHRSLMLDHVNTHMGTSDPGRYIGEVRNLEMVDGELYGDVVIVDKPLAMKIHYGAKVGYSPEFRGNDIGGKAVRLKYDGFALVLNPAVEGNWVRNEHGYFNSKIVNVNYNKQDEVKTLSDTQPEAQPNKKFDDLKDIFETFTAMYKAEHPDAKDFEIMTELNKVIKTAVADSKDEKSKEKVEPVPQEKPKEEPKQEPEVAIVKESPSEDKEAREKLKALESKFGAMERHIEDVDKKIVEVPDKKSAPVQSAVPEDPEKMDVDKMFMDYLQKNFKGYEVK